MKKLIVILTIAILFLMGCVDKSGTDKNIGNIKEVTNESDESADIVTNPNNENIENINVSTDAEVITDNDNVSVSEYTGESVDWCTIGNTVTEGNKQLTIKGLTTYEGREVCQAEVINGNEKTIFYFSQDGSYKSMKSTSSSGSGSSSASTSSDISINNK